MSFLMFAAAGVIEWGNVVLIGILVGIVCAVCAIVGVVLSYHRKNRSPIYPLDQFTNLNLTEQSDRYLYTRTTTRTINHNKK
ncbi:MAG: hypothetical protein J5958_00330 [Clostridia bacterium]|nr:hypothetical protein [Clostridia bacterium]MBR5044050.1 hypothetical protein [Clostridia bacterium]